MKEQNSLGNRMKTYYEEVPKTKLMRRCPVIIRIDGKAFHTFTKGMKKPFDDVLMKSMQDTTKYLCQNIQGCMLGYTQSDEISLLLIDYKDIKTAAWFDYEVQKVCSVAASMATMAFNKSFRENVENLYYNTKVAMTDEEERKWYELYESKFNKAMFDARCFNIPREDVANYFLWRQQDASRNSVQMVGRAYFSHKELDDKSNSEIQDMLMLQKGINWNDFPAEQKRGSCVVRSTGHELTQDHNFAKDGSVIGTSITVHDRWVVDKNIPIFSVGNWDYIEKHVFV